METLVLNPLLYAYCNEEKRSSNNGALGSQNDSLPLLIDVIVKRNCSCSVYLANYSVIACVIES